MGRAVTISKIYRTCLNLKQFKMIKKRTVKQILCKSAFVFAATFVLSLPTYARYENEVKVNTEANIKGRVVDSKTQHPLSHASVLVLGYSYHYHHRCRWPFYAAKSACGKGDCGSALGWL